MRFILIGNYEKDKQESMQRFAKMLLNGFSDTSFTAEVWKPITFFGAPFRDTSSGLGKWVGYLDKWLIFPLLLRWRIAIRKNINTDTRYHICDHSNAPYLSHLPIGRTSITCHDVIAIRAALGYTDAFVSSSRMGKLFQNWIVHHLGKARLIAAVSKLTLKQLQELVNEKQTSQEHWKVIYNAFNDNFFPLSIDEAAPLINKAGIAAGKPYILHVGSDLLRKNRGLLLDMVFALGNRWNGQICFAGKPADTVLLAHAERLHLRQRMVSVTNPDHETLRALYSRCEAFIFPSYSEGFGWPVIEAQSCGVPVITSNIEPMPEVSGIGARHCDPKKPEDFAEAFWLLQNEDIRVQLIEEGYRNTSRFNNSLMIKEYLSLHGM
jgi:glycosyltransferase involved in cell wall biosynthesis